MNQLSEKDALAICEAPDSIELRCGNCQNCCIHVFLDHNQVNLVMQCTRCGQPVASSRLGKPMDVKVEAPVLDKLLN